MGDTKKTWHTESPKQVSCGLPEAEVASMSPACVQQVLCISVVVLSLMVL